VLKIHSLSRVIHLPSAPGKVYASHLNLNIQINYTLTFDLYAEASRTHRSPVSLRPRTSWRRVLGRIISISLILILLAALSIRPDPTTPPGTPTQFTVDLTIPFSLLPHMAVAVFFWFAMFRRMTPSLRKAFLKPTALMYCASALFAIASGYIARQTPPPPEPPPAADVNPLQTWFAIGSWLLMFLMVWFSLAWMMRNVPHAEWEGQTHLHLPRHAIFTNGGVMMHTPHEKTEYLWSAFRNFRESPRQFLLYLSEFSFEIIPKSAFSPIDLADFTQFLHATLPPAIPAATAFNVKTTLPPPMLRPHVQSLEPREFI
jgi:hypothetical protein